MGKKKRSRALKAMAARSSPRATLKSALWLHYMGWDKEAEEAILEVIQVVVKETPRNG